MLYGLKKAPRVRHERPNKFFLKMILKEVKLKIPCLLKKGERFIAYANISNDILFGGTIKSLCKEISKLMSKELKMSLMGKLNFFVGLQIKQCQDDIFSNQGKYVRNSRRNMSLTIQSMSIPYWFQTVSLTWSPVVSHSLKRTQSW